MKSADASGTATKLAPPSASSAAQCISKQHLDDMLIKSLPPATTALSLYTAKPLSCQRGRGQRLRGELLVDFIRDPRKPVSVREAGQHDPSSRKAYSLPSRPARGMWQMCTSSARNDRATGPVRAQLTVSGAAQQGGTTRHRREPVPRRLGMLMTMTGWPDELRGSNARHLLAPPAGAIPPNLGDCLAVTHVMVPSASQAALASTSASASPKILVCPSLPPLQVTPAPRVYARVRSAGATSSPRSCRCVCEGRERGEGEGGVPRMRLATAAVENAAGAATPQINAAATSKSVGRVHRRHAHQHARRLPEDMKDTPRLALSARILGHQQHANRFCVRVRTHQRPFSPKTCRASRTPRTKTLTTTEGTFFTSTTHASAPSTGSHDVEHCHVFHAGAH
ncbi:hypothetical protein DFH06DRAFT_1416481 [Mycena polygramma]|nr:hypothetical protein DFH06DRAFT_1416481 [Mycena polygramma]